MSGRQREDLTGRRFGTLEVLGFDSIAKHGDAHWLVKCDCGKEKTMTGQILRGGVKSCGCLTHILNRNANRTHGCGSPKHRTREYESWLSMKARCCIPRASGYKYYGARGISICEQWLKSFPAFLSDMGKCPLGYTLERINNDGNYKPDNCRWATRKEQANNRSTCVYLRFNGSIKTISQWAEQYGMSASRLHHRIQYDKMSPEQAITTPVR
jgi:hypothetical protein